VSGGCACARSWDSQKRSLLRRVVRCARRASHALRQLFAALRRLFSLALAVGEQDASLLEGAFAESYPRKLRTRLLSAVASALPGWREASVASLVSLPRLLDAACSVGVTASGSSGGGSPAAVLLLRLDGTRRSTHELPEPRNLSLQLDRTTLAAVVRGSQALARRLTAVSAAAERTS